MSGSQSQGLEQTIGLRLSAQQLQLARLLELSAPELDERVRNELEANQALADASEEAPAEPQSLPAWYRPYLSSSQRDDDFQFTPVDASYSLYDYLKHQLQEKNLSDIMIEVAEFIIDSLEPSGYLNRSVQEITDDLAFGPGIDVSPELVQEALDIVRSLDPPGVGASDLQDALELQILAKPKSETRDNALNIIRHAYDSFAKKHAAKIASQLKISQKHVDEALKFIKSLNPKPGAAIGNDPADTSNIIIPDFLVDTDNDNISIILNNNIPELRIERSFAQAMEELRKLPRNKRGKDAKFIVDRYTNARDFIQLLTQRQKNMMTVMSAIVKLQEDYFRTQDVYTLRPMMIKDIAEITGLDFSVISRATNNKFVQTPWGIFPLRFFFSDAIGKEGEGSDVATNRQVEAAIKELIDNEDKKHPLSDRIIADEMVKRGFDLSRRTVAKYRDRLGIPVARLRK